jgi:phosphomannomutase
VDLLQNQLETRGRALEVPEDTLESAMRENDPFRVMEWLVPRRGELPPEGVQGLTATVEALLRRKILAHPGADGSPVTPVVFGTGGHRGEIGAGLTLLHVNVIVRALTALIAGMDDAQRNFHFGTGALPEVQRRGFVLGHDNRLFNSEFALYAAHLLREAGYAVRYAGRVSSPELSLLVPRQGWAGSLNFTPSHNPFRYGGLKFAPADGGLAGSELSDPLAAKANRLLEETGPEAWPPPEVLEEIIAAEGEAIERIEAPGPYLDALEEHPVIRLKELIAELCALPPQRRVLFVADPVWGAAVPVYRLLRERMGEDVMRLLHTEDDPYFGGQTTEPNEQTLGDALEVVRAEGLPFAVAIRNDPDGDRGLVGDAGGALKMNRFAAVVMRYLMDLGQTGDLVTTHATSHLGPEYARAKGCRVILTPTGFKNFRPHLAGGEALLAYEESDGMTIRGHTLDKDGVLAGLIALRMVLHYGKSLTELATEVEAEAGRYHYLQETFTILIPAEEARKKLARLSLVRPGDPFQAGGREHRVQSVNAEDGYKFVLESGAWIMMRPSGTEPKIRVYAESKEGAAETRILCDAAKAWAEEIMAG